MSSSTGRPAGTNPGGGAPEDATRADTWPGPAAPLAWLARLALVGALLGGLLGLLVGLVAEEEVTASATFEVVPDAQVLSGPLPTTVQTGTDDSVVAGRLEVLDALRLSQEEQTDDAVTVSVAQVGTSDVLRISATAPTAEQAVQAVTTLLDGYVTARQEAAGTAVTAALDAVQQRLDALGEPGAVNSPVAQEVERLLAEQSQLTGAATRVPDLVPVLRDPTVDEETGAPAALLSTVLGAVLGAVLLLAAGAVWRATSNRLFDARLLVAAGVPVLLPRLPTGRVRGRSPQVPARLPRAEALSAARLLVPQVLDVSAGARRLVVVGADERAGAAEVAWELAWAISSTGAPVVLVSTAAHAHSARPAASAEFPGEQAHTPLLTVVAVPPHDGDAALAATVARHTAAGRHVLLHAPALTSGARFDGTARHAEQAVVVVGEGVTSLEDALAAVRDVTSSGPALRGVVVTTTGRHLGRDRPQPSPPRAAEETTSPRQEPVASEA
ncbi:hypothetical protein O2V63_00010 [Modestobacter sp. VKM Ac-2977]|uniref:hypothetical protein n=1 Tax=Modestobacter sp. VKM Ac-2977 TaxID=3004131 RepID=UPI0022AAB3DF|nr:hypothetical protein [Modestobacter sp. VKM Ac-2977]MCZ2818717.1 hypothetical protein [Modestobacter sp. VKM Ac-2977]